MSKAASQGKMCLVVSSQVSGVSVSRCSKGALA